MKKIRNFIVWSLVFIGLLLAFDLVMVRSTDLPPALAGVQRFYVDFRARLLGLVGDSSPASIETVIEKTATPAAGTAAAAGQRYLYVDNQGQLQFADSLAEVPQAYRKSAQPLKE